MYFTKNNYTSILPTLIYFKPIIIKSNILYKYLKVILDIKFSGIIYITKYKNKTKNLL